ncbi:hypothetical protein JYU14_04430 [Simkania negevensis]|uniref:Uncharacterized protein n=1 Tax=Simkania negevensis TaxID=83561 RepID=A0ABS3ARE5_9BACT|nr:hypothetical protein [Simkania negevensis]
MRTQFVLAFLPPTTSANHLQPSAAPSAPAQAVGDDSVRPLFAGIFQANSPFQTAPLPNVMLNQAKVKELAQPQKLLPNDERRDRYEISLEKLFASFDHAIVFNSFAHYLLNLSTASDTNMEVAAFFSPGLANEQSFLDSLVDWLYQRLPNEIINRQQVAKRDILSALDRFLKMLEQKRDGSSWYRQAATLAMCCHILSALETSHILFDSSENIYRALSSMQNFYTNPVQEGRRPSTNLKRCHNHNNLPIQDSYPYAQFHLNLNGRKMVVSMRTGLTGADFPSDSRSAPAVEFHYGHPPVAVALPLQAGAWHSTTTYQHLAKNHEFAIPSNLRFDAIPIDDQRGHLAILLPWMLYLQENWVPFDPLEMTSRFFLELAFTHNHHTRSTKKPLFSFAIDSFTPFLHPNNRHAFFYDLLRLWVYLQIECQSSPNIYCKLAGTASFDGQAQNVQTLLGEVVKADLGPLFHQVFTLGKEGEFPLLFSRTLLDYLKKALSSLVENATRPTELQAKRITDFRSFLEETPRSSLIPLLFEQLLKEGEEKDVDQFLDFLLDSNPNTSEKDLWQQMNPLSHYFAQTENNTPEAENRVLAFFKVLMKRNPNIDSQIVYIGLLRHLPVNFDQSFFLLMAESLLWLFKEPIDGRQETKITNLKQAWLACLTRGKKVVKGSFLFDLVEMLFLLQEERTSKKTKGNHQQHFAIDVTNNVINFWITIMARSPNQKLIPLAEKALEKSQWKDFSVEQLKNYIASLLKTNTPESKLKALTILSFFAQKESFHLEQIISSTTLNGHILPILANEHSRGILPSNHYILFDPNLLPQETGLSLPKHFFDNLNIISQAPSDANLNIEAVLSTYLSKRKGQEKFLYLFLHAALNHYKSTSLPSFVVKKLQAVFSSLEQKLEECSVNTVVPKTLMTAFGQLQPLVDLLNERRIPQDEVSSLLVSWDLFLLFKEACDNSLLEKMREKPLIPRLSPLNPDSLIDAKTVAAVAMFCHRNEQVVFEDKTAILFQKMLSFAKNSKLTTLERLSIWLIVIKIGDKPSFLQAITDSNDQIKKLPIEEYTEFFGTSRSSIRPLEHALTRINALLIMEIDVNESDPLSTEIVSAKEISTLYRWLNLFFFPNTKSFDPLFVIDSFLTLFSMRGKNRKKIPVASPVEVESCKQFEHWAQLVKVFDRFFQTENPLNPAKINAAYDLLQMFNYSPTMERGLFGMVGVVVSSVYFLVNLLQNLQRQNSDNSFSIQPFQLPIESFQKELLQIFAKMPSEPGFFLEEQHKGFWEALEHFFLFLEKSSSINSIKINNSFAFVITTLFLRFSSASESDRFYVYLGQCIKLLFPKVREIKDLPQTNDLSSDKTMALPYTKLLWKVMLLVSKKGSLPLEYTDLLIAELEKAFVEIGNYLRRPEMMQTSNTALEENIFICSEMIELRIRLSLIKKESSESMHSIIVAYTQLAQSSACFFCYVSPGQRVGDDSSNSMLNFWKLFFENCSKNDSLIAQRISLGGRYTLAFHCYQSLKQKNPCAKFYILQKVIVPFFFTDCAAKIPLYLKKELTEDLKETDPAEFDLIFARYLDLLFCAFLEKGELLSNQHFQQSLRTFAAQLIEKFSESPFGIKEFSDRIEGFIENAAQSAHGPNPFYSLLKVFFKEEMDKKFPNGFSNCEWVKQLAKLMA